MSARKHDESGFELSPGEASALEHIKTKGWRVGAWVAVGKGYQVGLWKPGPWPILCRDVARGDLPAFAAKLESGAEV